MLARPFLMVVLDVDGARGNVKPRRSQPQYCTISRTLALVVKASDILNGDVSILGYKSSLSDFRLTFCSDQTLIFRSDIILHNV